MKTDITVTYEDEDIEALCSEAYIKRFGPAPEGMEVTAAHSSYGSCKVSLIEIEKETPVPVVQEWAPNSEVTKKEGDSF